MAYYQQSCRHEGNGVQDGRVEKRTSSNKKKDSRRNGVLNEAFVALRTAIPFTSSHSVSNEDAADKRLSKIQILRLAMSYIQHLDNLVKGGDSDNNFQSVVRAQVETKNSYKARAELELTGGQTAAEQQEAQTKDKQRIRGHKPNSTATSSGSIVELESVGDENPTTFYQPIYPFYPPQLRQLLYYSPAAYCAYKSETLP